MKFRNGFVSNSSTTSFSIVGICLDDEQISQLRARFNIEDDDSWYEVSEKCEEDGFSTHESYYDSGELVVGLTFDQMEEDETKKEFKGRIAKKITEFFGIEDPKISLHEGAWRDG